MSGGEERKKDMVDKSESGRSAGRRRAEVTREAKELIRLIGQHPEQHDEVHRRLNALADEMDGWAYVGPVLEKVYLAIRHRPWRERSVSRLVSHPVPVYSDRMKMFARSTVKPELAWLLRKWYLDANPSATEEDWKKLWQTAGSRDLQRALLRGMYEMPGRQAWWTKVARQSCHTCWHHAAGYALNLVAENSLVDLRRLMQQTRRWVQEQRITEEDGLALLAVMNASMQELDDLVAQIKPGRRSKKDMVERLEHMFMLHVHVHNRLLQTFVDRLSQYASSHAEFQAEAALPPEPVLVVPETGL